MSETSKEKKSFVKKGIALIKNFLTWIRNMKTKDIGIISIILIVFVIVLCSIQVNKAYTSRIINLRMENIGELNTQAGYFTNVQVISKSREVFGVEVPFTQNKYIYSYDGVIKAGIDFSQVKVEVDSINKQAKISIPKAEINSIEVDEDSLVVYDETKNIFTPLKLDDIRNSRLKMEEEAKLRVEQNGILEEATNNAKTLIWALLQSDGEVAECEPVWIILEEEEK